MFFSFYTKDTNRLPLSQDRPVVAWKFVVANCRRRGRSNSSPTRRTRSGRRRFEDLHLRRPPRRRNWRETAKRFLRLRHPN